MLCNILSLCDTISLLRFGRRVAILVDCIPLSVGWLLTWQARTLTHLYIARTITGVGIGAGVPIASIYLRQGSFTQESNSQTK